MAKIMTNQKWSQINEYPLDYYELIYQYYSAADHNQVPVTYYNLDISNSVLDTEVLDAGSYEMMGEYSGWLWKKILMLPVYNLEAVDLTMNADETGVTNQNQQTTLYIPQVYEIIPKVHDHLIYDQLSWRNDSFKSNLQMFEVMNISKSSDADVTFWKLMLKASSKTKEQIEQQLSSNLTFVNYEKRIYTTDDAIYFARQMDKNINLDMKDLFNNKLGTYTEQI